MLSQRISLGRDDTLSLDALALYVRLPVAPLTALSATLDSAVLVAMNTYSLMAASSTIFPAGNPHQDIRHRVGAPVACSLAIPRRFWSDPDKFRPLYSDTSLTLFFFFSYSSFFISPPHRMHNFASLAHFSPQSDSLARSCSGTTPIETRSASLP